MQPEIIDQLRRLNEHLTHISEQLNQTESAAPAVVATIAASIISGLLAGLALWFVDRRSAHRERLNTANRWFLKVIEDCSVFINATLKYQRHLKYDRPQLGVPSQHDPEQFNRELGQFDEGVIDKSDKLFVARQNLALDQDALNLIFGSVPSLQLRQQIAALARLKHNDERGNLMDIGEMQSLMLQILQNVRKEIAAIRDSLGGMSPKAAPSR